MYELTISAPKNQEHLLAYVKLQTCQAVAEMDGISTDLQDDTRCYYSVACADTFRFQLKRLLLEAVAETVALGYKNIFMRDYLRVGKGNFYQNVLVNTMCVFDKSYDQQIIAKILDVDKPIFIDGYCNFRLALLKQKWREIAKLVTENNYILHDDNLILEFLQYLLESVECKIPSLSLTVEKDNFYLYDSQNNVMDKITSLVPTATVEEEAALNVILLKPKRLTVYYGEKPSEAFFRVLQLFDCKFVCVK